MSACSTSENSDVFNSRDKICLVFTEKKVNFLFILYVLSKNHLSEQTAKFTFFLAIPHQFRMAECV